MPLDGRIGLDRQITDDGLLLEEMEALFVDEELTPIRGQLTFLVPQPEVTYATSYENTYMFSRRDGVLLGGTHEMGDWNLQPDLTTKAAILAKQAGLFDGMRDC